MSKFKSAATPKTTTSQAVSRVQSAVAKQHGGQVPPGSYVGRLQAAAAHHASKTPKR